MATELKFDLNFKTGNFVTISLGDFAESSASVQNFKTQLMSLNESAETFFDSYGENQFIDPYAKLPYSNQDNATYLGLGIKSTGAATNAHIINKYITQII